MKQTPKFKYTPGAFKLRVTGTNVQNSKRLSVVGIQMYTQFCECWGIKKGVQAFWKLPECISLRLTGLCTQRRLRAHVHMATTFKTRAQPEPWECLMKRMDGIRTGLGHMEL